MKIVLKESVMSNYPDNCYTAVSPVEGQALEDTAEFNKRREEAEAEIQKRVKLPVDGAPKAEKPQVAKLPKINITEAYNNGVREYTDMLYDMVMDDVVDSKAILQSLMYWVSEDDVKRFMEVNDLLFDDVDDEYFNEALSLEEHLDEMEVAHSIQDILRIHFGLDVDVQTYKDNEHSNSVIVQFIVSAEDNDKLVYDDLKELIYEKYKDEINISVKTFGSPNLEDKQKVEYKIKIFVIKESVDKWGAKKAKTKSYSRSKDKKLTEGANWVSHEDYFVETPSISDDLIKLSGIDSMGDNVSKKKKALTRYITSHYDVVMDPDGSCIRHSEFQGDEEWSLQVFGTRENLTKFLVDVNMPYCVEDIHEVYRDVSDKDDFEDDMDLMTLLLNELDAGYGENDKNRRFAAANCNKDRIGLDTPVIFNADRYVLHDSKTALNGHADVEVKIVPDDYDMKIEIRPFEGKSLDFARKVVDMYSDFDGIKYEEKENLRNGGMMGIITVPDYEEDEVIDKTNAFFAKHALKYRPKKKK